MNNRLATMLLALMATAAVSAKVSLTALKVENLSNPQGIDTQKPRFSWQLLSDKNGVEQKAYHIIIYNEEETLWDSQKTDSDQQQWITYGGKALASSQFLRWKLKVYTNRGETEWTEGTPFSTGLLNESKWRGYWIGLEKLLPGEERGMHTRLAARYLRKEFSLKDKELKRATAYVAGIGLHEFYVNGQKQGDRVLSPVPSDYRKTIYYNTYDITTQLEKGQKICLGIVLGNGRLFPMQQHKPYKIPVFGFPKCRINVLVEYADGSKETLQTDDKGWRVTANGPIRSNNEYDGEEYDARMELDGWASVGYDDSNWMAAERTDIPQALLSSQMTEGMTILKTLKPKSITTTNEGTIVDLGQNIAGWLKLRVRGAEGDTLRVVYAEKLNENGTLYRDNFRNAHSTDIYVCNGRETNTTWWNPTFVYHGFRYVLVSGLKNASVDDFKADVVADEMAETGSFLCSDTILNKVVANAAWGIIDNYKGMPVDCPQRDERQPWLGDRTMGSLGESYLFANERLYSKWMRDICEAQRTDGCIPDVAPTFWNYFSDNITWPSALPFSCDMLYRQYGNARPIQESYPYIKKWINHIIDEYERNGIIEKDRYGDWCVPPEKLELIHSADPDRITDGALISTAYIIRNLQLMLKWADEKLIDNTDSQRWQSLLNKLTEAFNKKFLTEKHNTSPRPGHVFYPDSVFYGNNTVTANILPLAMGIVPDNCREDVVKQVVENIVIKSKEHVSCGVIGISWLMRTLSDNGFADVAWRLATQKSYPSWGYMAENGATTIWELWNGDKANPRMNSGNHVMLLGDLLTWCYQYLAGIRSDDGYKNIVLKPDFTIQDCENVDASYNTPYGMVVSKWQKTLQHLTWHVEIPCNTHATLYLPNGKTEAIGSGAYDFKVDIPTKHEAILKDEFLYDHTYFPEPHASTIVELKNGDLVAGYFGGTHERDPNVCIWVNIKKKGSNEWSKPVLAADGVVDIASPVAPYAGLSGMQEDTTPATEGPIKATSLPESWQKVKGSKTNTKGKKGGKATANKSEAIADELTYSYATKTSTLTEVPASLKRKACWNPVLYEMPNGELWLFFKIGATVGDWTGWVAKSKDGGKTWSDKEPLPEKYIGPVKNKPELIDGRLICGSSTEGNGWRFHVEILDLKDNLYKTDKPVRELNWKRVGPVDAEKVLLTQDMEPSSTSTRQPTPKADKEPGYIYSIQPSILKLKDGRLQVLMRTRNAWLAQSFSSDGGDTWSKVTLSNVENNQSGTDAVTLSNGQHILIYNDFETLPGTPKGPRTPVSIAISDDGKQWKHVLTLEDSPLGQYSYPAIIEGRDGTLHCVYTWRRQRVSYKQIDPKKL